MTRRPAGSLNQRRLAAQKSLLVRVQNADKRHFRKIETFTEQIDADKNVEIGRAQSAQNFHALDCVDVAVEIAHFQSDIAQIIGEIFRGSFGQCRNQDAFGFFHALPTKLDCVVDLVLEWFDRDSRIEQTGRPNDLLDHERCTRSFNVESFGRIVGRRDLHISLL